MDAITLFKQAAAQMQKEEAYLYYAHARQQNDEDAALQDAIGEFNLVKMELQQWCATRFQKNSRTMLHTSRLRTATLPLQCLLPPGMVIHRNNSRWWV